MVTGTYVRPLVIINCLGLACKSSKKLEIRRIPEEYRKDIGRKHRKDTRGIPIRPLTNSHYRHLPLKNNGNKGISEGHRKFTGRTTDGDRLLEDYQAIYPARDKADWPIFIIKKNGGILVEYLRNIKKFIPSLNDVIVLIFATQK